MAISKKVLLYYPSNKRSIAIETICRAVKDAGHEISVLTLSGRDTFHESVEKMGIRTYVYALSRKPSWKYFLNHTRYLIRFCRKNKIDTVWSHFPEANVIAILASKFLKIRVVAFRHHDESAFYAEYGSLFRMKRNPKEKMLDRFINKFANPLAVLSTHVLETILKYEKGERKRIVVCPLIYDFGMYGNPDEIKVQEIKEKTPAHLRLIMIGRMFESKQHLPAFETVNKLIKEGLSIKMIVVDDGPVRPILENFVSNNNLSEHILMPGFCDDIINYMAAADLLIHPSLTEASNNVVKEMGYLQKAVAVCKGVGDFDDYIRDNRNGYLMERGDLKASIERVLRRAYSNSEQLSEMGKKLKVDVLHLFSDTLENRERFLQLV